MRPLPVRPNFPIFGLPASFTGVRWLLLWQRTHGAWEGDIREVSLGHGHPHDGPCTAVNTTRKQLERPTPGGGSTGPFNLAWASLHAIHGMVESNGKTWRGSASLLEDELDRVTQHQDGHTVFVGWDQQRVPIDGVDRNGWVRRLERAWGLVVELPDVVITASGPITAIQATQELSDVTSRLGDYAAGFDEQANSIIG